jgi:hypothetical protein
MPLQILSAPKLAHALALTALAVTVLFAPATAMAKTVTLAMVVKLDEVAPEDLSMYRVGGQDLDRIAYDDGQIDPVKHTAPVHYLAHFIAGRWMPVESMEAASYNLDTNRLQASASVDHGRDLTVLFDAGGRMAMLARPDFHMLIAGSYTIDPRPLTPAEVSSRPTGWDSPDTMPMMKGMPPLPGMSRTANVPASH